LIALVSESVRFVEIVDARLSLFQIEFYGLPNHTFIGKPAVPITPAQD